MTKFYGIRLLDGSAIVGVYRSEAAALDALTVLLAGRGTVVAHPYSPAA